MAAADRFLRYAACDTQFDEHSDVTLSAAKQKVLDVALAEKLA